MPFQTVLYTYTPLGYRQEVEFDEQFSLTSDSNTGKITVSLDHVNLKNSTDTTLSRLDYSSLSFLKKNNDVETTVMSLTQTSLDFYYSSNNSHAEYGLTQIALYDNSGNLGFKATKNYIALYNLSGSPGSNLEITNNKISINNPSSYELELENSGVSIKQGQHYLMSLSTSSLNFKDDNDNVNAIYAKDCISLTPTSGNNPYIYLKLSENNDVTINNDNFIIQKVVSGNHQIGTYKPYELSLSVTDSLNNKIETVISYDGINTTKITGVDVQGQLTKRLIIDSDVQIGVADSTNGNGLEILGSLSVAGTSLNVTNNISIGGNASITGDTTLHDINIGGNASITGDTTLQDINIGGNASITGKTTLHDINITCINCNDDSSLLTLVPNPTVGDIIVINNTKTNGGDTQSANAIYITLYESNTQNKKKHIRISGYSSLAFVCTSVDSDSNLWSPLTTDFYVNVVPINE